MMSDNWLVVMSSDWESPVMHAALRAGEVHANLIAADSDARGRRIDKQLQQPHLCF
jgi:hypothetical protein